MSQRLNSCGSSSLYIKPKKHLHDNVWVFFCCIMSRFGILWK
nr:MAG TPA: hypothetical protein [Caudoviricetes sp.]